MNREEYKRLIKITEEKKNRLLMNIGNPKISKKLVYHYLDKYNALLLDLYTKYEEINIINRKIP